MATYVLVHGGGHGGWCYQRVARILQAKGHVVYTPTMTGLGARPPAERRGGPAPPHRGHCGSAPVRGPARRHSGRAQLRRDGHHGHGRPGGDRIGRLVFLDAANPVNGQSSPTWPVPSSMPSAPSARPSTAWSWCCSRPRCRPALRRHGPDDLAWMAERLTPHPWKCFEQPLELTNEAALSAIPQYHIVCTSTLATRDKDLLAGPRRGTALGHRHRTRSDDHRAGESHGALLQVAGLLTYTAAPSVYA